MRSSCDAFSPTEIGGTNGRRSTLPHLLPPQDLSDWEDPFWGNYAARRAAWGERRKNKPRERQFLIDYCTSGLSHWPNLAFYE